MNSICSQVVSYQFYCCCYDSKGKTVTILRQPINQHFSQEVIPSYQLILGTQILSSLAISRVYLNFKLAKFILKDCWKIVFQAQQLLIIRIIMLYFYIFENCMISETQEFQAYNPQGYINNWIPVSMVTNSIKPKAPFKKLKIFPKQNLKKSHETTIYKLYLQKIYISIYAHLIEGHLEFSRKFYEKNGLIFGIYDIQTKDQYPTKKFKGIQMVQCEEDSWKEIIEEIFDELKEKINQLSPQNIQEYQHSQRGIKMLLLDQKVTPLSFLQGFQKLPLTEHYIHKVREQNALLSSIFNNENQNTLISKSKREQKILDNIFYDNGDIKEAYSELEKMLQEIYLALYNKGKIGTAEGPEFKKIKDDKGKKFEKSFAIILSQYRMQIITNQKQMQEIQKEKSHQNSTNPTTTNSQTNNSKQKLWTKIQIKSKNGALEPISGNAIFVKFTWEVIAEEHKTFLEVHCCNNRKVQEMYYNQILEFWEELQKDQRFRNLTGIDKYFIQLNEQKQTMEVIFSNFIPFCILTNALREIDKIVALALSMDQIIQICERKGLEKQNHQYLQIKPYMKDEVIKKFKWSLDRIEKLFANKQSVII